MMSDLIDEMHANQSRNRMSGTLNYIRMELPITEDSSIVAPDKLDDASELQNILDDLADVREEAISEQFPVPSQQSLDQAERIIRELYAIYPTRYEVSADPDGAVAIDVRNGRGQWILLLCESDGGALVLTNLEIGESHRYASVRDVPDSFLCDALDLLERGTP